MRLVELKQIFAQTKIGPAEAKAQKGLKKTKKLKLMSLGNALEFLAKSWPQHHSDGSEDSTNCCPRFLRVK